MRVDGAVATLGATVDPAGRRTVFDLLPKVAGLTYVGRSDVMTSSLLLLTTDGAAVHRLTHPRFEVSRTYWLRAHGPSADAVRAAVEVVGYSVRSVGGSVEVELTLAEGRHRIERLHGAA